MTIPTAACGLVLGERESVLTPRRMLAFAAGLGDLTPALFDDLSDDFIAHPALCVALEWPLISDPATAARLSSDPRERARAVHAVQDSHFHRPLRAGDRLRTRGEVAGIWRGASGVRVASSVHTTDESGRPAVSSHLLAVYRGVEAEGEDRPLHDAPALPQSDGSEQDLPSVDWAVDAAMPHRYTECSGIWNPIHTERRAALAAGLPGVMLHGSATWAWAGSALVGLLAPGRPQALRRLHGRFTAFVFPGSTVRLQARQRRIGGQCQVFFSVLTGQGQPAIADGFALIDTPIHA